MPGFQRSPTRTIRRSLAWSQFNQVHHVRISFDGFVLDRQTLAEVGSCGRLGRQAGQFVSPHNIATDSKGNLYIAGTGAGIQKLTFKRMASTQ